MPNEIYHRSNWGNAKAEGFGDVYFDAAATNKLYNHSDYYENSNGTDKILRDLSNKASIVLTPTAYSNGSLNTVIPPYGLGIELLTGFTNGTTYSFTTFETDGNNITSAIVSSDFAGAVSNAIALVSGKTYNVTFNYIKNSGDDLRVVFSSSNNGAGSQVSNNHLISESGSYTKTFTVTSSGTAYLQMGTGNANHSLNVSITNVSVKEIQEADFDFSRGSSATRVNEKGLIEDVQILSGELVQNGNFATDSDWIKETGWTISGGKANKEGAIASNFYQILFTAGKKYRLTFEISNSNNGRLLIYFGGAVSEDILSASNGIYTFDNVANQDTLIFRNAGWVGSIDNVSVIEITDDTDLPRIDYTSGFGSLLLEPQRTNLITYSEDFSQWILGSNSTLTYVSDVVAPDGSLGVYRLTNPASGATYIQSPSFSISNPLTISLYVKSTGSGNDDFNLYTGASNISDLKTATSEWQRFDYTADGSSMYIINSGDTYESDIYIWGSQAEAGSYATSYIPTSGSTVTRSADVANNSGNADLFNDSEGVLYWECSSLFDDLTNRIISISQGNQNNTVQLYFDASSNRIRGTVRAVDGTYQCILNYTVSDTTDYVKAAIKYKDNDFALWVNGLERAIDTSGNAPTGLSKLSFDSGSGSSDFYGKVKDVRYYNTALSDSELQALTS